MRSDQRAPHPDLARQVRRHLAAPLQRPIAAHSLEAFRGADAALARHGGPVVLDSGCGTGEAVAALARAHPGALVVAVDKSRARLARAAPRAGAVHVRADLRDFWRLARATGWPITANYLLYPNPWPKQRHLVRRWHAHPVFPEILALGGRLELRVSWRVYAEEFAAALALAGVREAGVESFLPETITTAFERKYLAAGLPLYRVTTTLSARGGVGFAARPAA